MLAIRQIVFTDGFKLKGMRALRGNVTAVER